MPKGLLGLMFILSVHIAWVLGAALSWFSPLSWARCQKLAGHSGLHAFVSSTFEGKSDKRAKNVFRAGLVTWSYYTSSTTQTFKRHLKHSGELTVQKEGEWWNYIVLLFLKSHNKIHTKFSSFISNIRLAWCGVLHCCVLFWTVYICHYKMIQLKATAAGELSVCLLPAPGLHIPRYHPT